MMLADRPAQQAMPHDSLSAKKMTLRKIARKNLLGITQDLIAAGRDVASRRASLRLPLGLRFSLRPARPPSARLRWPPPVRRGRWMWPRGGLLALPRRHIQKSFGQAEPTVGVTGLAISLRFGPMKNRRFPCNTPFSLPRAGVAPAELARPRLAPFSFVAACSQPLGKPGGCSLRRRVG